MGIIMQILNPLINRVKNRDALDKMKRGRTVLDHRIEKLAKATINGDEDWFIRVVRKDPSCALRVIEECHKNENSG